MGKIVAAILFLGGVFGAFYFYKGESLSLVSPIPTVFGVQKEEIVEKNTWFPQKPTADTKKGPTLGAKAAILVDYDTGRVIYSKNTGERLPIASTVKIMTALIALERAKLSDTYPVSEFASKVGENSMGLTQGEKLSVRDLLYGMMLVSGNDAAVAVAEGVSGSQDEFVNLMNGRLESIGVGDTKFINASGLDEDGRVQYSTAWDLAVISHYVWEMYPEFREISSTYEKFIEGSSDHKAFTLYNDTNLLTTYPGVKGIKPGFTWEAGLCLVTYAENDGKKLIAVILGSDDRRGEMKELLDYGFGTYGIKVEHPGLDL